MKGSTYDGRELPEERIQEMFGPSEVGMIEQNLMNQANIANAISYYCHVYQEKHNEYVRPFIPLHDLLVDVKKAGYQIAIFTGKGRRSLDISLDQLGLNGLFDVLISGDDVTQLKPDPQGLHIIMKELGSQPQDMLMIGDSDADIEAGRRANVPSIRVDWLPSVSPKSFQYKFDDYMMTDVKELRNLLRLL
ncbi:HAD family hydrolase [Alicyclobacillus dauci]|uniref:HAD family hydrolase n=1 Tax=Alicyclobacillus dauci TaxID=1475485 RepID=A0ABY6Z8C9_9BACL|nr:HAD-IA family hydrolase [Alicyclobacillus dauci]WAH39147.1 HAD family hydrolase [Alicyclobacillus dauci]